MGICISDSNSKNEIQLVKIINSHNILEIRLNIIYENYIWNRFTGWNTYQSEEMLYREAIAYIIQYSKKNNIYIVFSSTFIPENSSLSPPCFDKLIVLNLLYLEYLKKYLLDNNIILPSNIIIK
jgi:hypothetical protein